MNRREGIDRLEELFHQALELEPEARARFIAGVRDLDAGLGAEVESLVAAHEEGSNLLDTPPGPSADAQAAHLAGSSIAQYQVLELLGKGGMGEVWRARDTRLNRDVALKVLPEAFANSADRLARFQREAQVLASLNHPNIAVIYDLVESEGEQVLVMEMVEGETLADKLKTGALPLPESLSIALQIAEALRAAHKKGIIHRDLKPANIKIKPEGQVKVLDFGLAKQFHGAGSDTDSQAATLKESMTVAGAIIGTPAYMSPEQAVGEAADPRSDIFSFGAVLYEMLTGRRAFSGKTVTALFHAILTSTPASPKRLRPEVPVELDALVNRALNKERHERQQNCEQLCLELSLINTNISEKPSLLKNRRAALVASALLLLLILGAIGWQVLRWRDASNTGTPAGAIRVNPAASSYELFQQGVAYLERWDIEKNIDAALQ
ncbi:MAG TPA: serine/threonine-protein kinase, partial [Blastocatellia bacterium]